MAEIRCPMCGRDNPEERDVCEYCGARLKPLTEALSAANAEPIRPGEEPTPQSTSELEKTLPDWLRKLRQPMPVSCIVSLSLSGATGSCSTPLLPHEESRNM